MPLAAASAARCVQTAQQRVLHDVLGQRVAPRMRRASLSAPAAWRSRQIAKCPLVALARRAP